MSERLLDFVIDSIEPIVKGKLDLRYDVNLDEEELENKDQINLRGLWKSDHDKLIYLRVANKNGEKLLTLVGGNSSVGYRFVMSVNGDDSWREEFNKGLEVFMKDSYLCTPDDSNTA